MQVAENSPTLLFYGVDIYIAFDSTNYERTKYIELNYHFIYDHVNIKFSN